MRILRWHPWKRPLLNALGLETKSRAAIVEKARSSNPLTAAEAMSHLVRVGCFHSASQVANRLDLDAQADSLVLTAASAFLSSRRGPEGDALLEARLAVHADRPPVQIVAQFGEVIASCGWPEARRVATLRAMIEALQENDRRSFRARARLKWTLFKLLRGRERDPDIAWYADLDSFDPAAPRPQLRYLEHFHAQGLVDVARDLLERSAAARGPLDPDVVIGRLRLDPTWMDAAGIASDDLAAHHGSAALLRAVATHAPSSPAARSLMEACIANQSTKLAKLSGPARVGLLTLLVHQDRIHEVLDLAERHSLPDTMLMVTCARALHAYAGGDWYTAKDLFAQVLEEDPNHSVAGDGLRLALPRTGAGPGGMIAVRNRLGYGLAGAGRTGLRPAIGRDAVIEVMMMGRYAEGLRAKRGVRHWALLKRTFGDRFLNVERLPEDAAERSLFVIGDDGVGDEIRTSQFYETLVKRFASVTISCDPRLESLLVRSFPEITFVPVQRWRAGLDRSGRMGDARISGLGPDLPRLLTEACRSHMDAADLLTFGQTLFFDHFANGLDRPAPGGYLRATAPQAHPNDGVLRVGLLWRSHMRTLWRKFMYLDIADFLPVLDIEGVEFWSIQHAIDDEERAFCATNGVRLVEDIDLFNDLDGLASVVVGLDMATGLSSAPLELAAAVGTPVRMLGFSPENYYLRTTGGRNPIDRLTCNSRVVAPPWIDFTAPRQDCIDLVMAELRRELCALRDTKRARHSATVPNFA